MRNLGRIFKFVFVYNFLFDFARVPGITLASRALRSRPGHYACAVNNSGHLGRKTGITDACFCSEISQGSPVISRNKHRDMLSHQTKPGYKLLQVVTICYIYADVKRVWVSETPTWITRTHMAQETRKQISLNEHLVHSRGLSVKIKTKTIVRTVLHVVSIKNDNSLKLIDV